VKKWNKIYCLFFFSYQICLFISDRSGTLFDLEDLKHSLYKYTTAENTDDNYSFDDTTKITVDDVMKSCGEVLFYPEKIGIHVLNTCLLLYLNPFTD
jgi:hypothetical protein